MTAITSDHFSMLPRKASTSPHVIPESLFEIRRRYEDASIVIYKERQHQLLRSSTSRPINGATSFLSYGDRRGAGDRAATYRSYGNPAVVIQRRGNNVIKADEKTIESRVCVVM